MKNSLLGAPTHHNQQKIHNNKPNFNNMNKRRPIPPPQQHQQQQQQQQIGKTNNEEQNNLNKLKICMEANRRNINQRLNINNNSNGQIKNHHNHQQQQQQNEQNRFQNNKQLIVIKTGENDNSIKNSGLKRTLSSDENETAKKLCQEQQPTQIDNNNRVAVVTNDLDEESMIITVECKIKNKQSNDENYEFDAFYCKCCCLIIHDQNSIESHLINETHKTNVSCFF